MHSRSCVVALHRRRYVAWHLNLLFAIAISSWNRVQDSHNPLIDREQDASTKDGSSQPHRRAFPKAPEPIVRHDASASINRGGTLRTLAPCLDRVQGLCRVCRNHSSHCSIREINRRTLPNVLRLLNFLHNVVGAHAKRRGESLFQRRASETVI